MELVVSDDSRRAESKVELELVLTLRLNVADSTR
jgi:hypothetical protein